MSAGMDADLTVDMILKAASESKLHSRQYQERLPKRRKAAAAFGDGQDKASNNDEVEYGGCAQSCWTGKYDV
eukprot:3935615-Pyramimonas_sp.AAC.1